MPQMTLQPEWMPVIPYVQACPPGLEYLDRLNQVRIRPRLDTLESK